MKTAPTIAPLHRRIELIAQIFYLCLCIALLMMWASLSKAQSLGGRATLETSLSQITDLEQGFELELHISQTVPYQTFILNDPERLVLDFNTLSWGSADLNTLFQHPLITNIRTGQRANGWSRLVFDLAAPLELAFADLKQLPSTQSARLNVQLRSPNTQPKPQNPQDSVAQQPIDTQVPSERRPPKASNQEFSRAKPPPFRPSDLAQINAAAPQTQTPRTFIVVIDPGHGGRDPGAERDGLKEADLMLSLAIELADALNRTTGIRAVLTRQDDRFLALEERMSLARLAQADLFLSLHADALEGGGAHGASIYRLSARGQDQATQRMAERHSRSDLISGLDLSQQDDRVASILMDMARAETTPSAQRLSETMVKSLERHGARINTKPLREGIFAVLMSADFPSLLVEAGFLSNPKDRKNLRTPQGRRPIVRGLAHAIATWKDDEQIRKPLLRR